MDLKESDLVRLVGTCADVAFKYPDVIYIDGLAVYLHAINHPETASYAEATHDAAFYISLADMGDLRDDEEVTANRRLSKSQFVKGGWAFDVYTERLSELLVPFDRVSAHALSYGGLRVASLAHLLILKTEAACARTGSAKGDKDIRDLLRIAVVAKTVPLDAPEAALFLSGDHWALLERIEKQHSHALGMASGNAQSAKQIRAAFAGLLERLSTENHDGSPPAARREPGL